MKLPLARRKPDALDGLCLRAIGFYQRQLSPRKGYRCAHARLHGGDGCSGFACQTIVELGARAALPRIRQRFAACRLAGQTLRAQSDVAPVNLDKSGRPRRTRNDESANESCGDFGWFCCAESLFDGTACEVASCADASCADASCADASCADAACGCHSCL